MGIADPSKRLEAMPPYKFQELERQIADKRAAGIDVISLGIGDPDEPTYPYIVKAMQEAVADPATHQYPSNRGREDFRQALADFYGRRFGVEIDPATEVIPAIGAKECIYNLCFAFLDPGDVALASDPGYPVYTGGPILAGATPELLPLVPELGFVPDLGAVPADVAARARLMTDLAAAQPDVAEPFIQVLNDKGLFAVDKSLKLLADKSRTGFLPFERYDVDMDLLRGFPAEVCRRWCVAPFDRMSKSILVATANPFNQQAAKELAEATSNRLLWYLTSPAELVQTIRKAFR